MFHLCSFDIVFNYVRFSTHWVLVYSLEQLIVGMIYRICIVFAILLLNLTDLLLCLLWFESFWERLLSRYAILFSILLNFVFII